MDPFFSKGSKCITGTQTLTNNNPDQKFTAGDYYSEAVESLQVDFFMF